MLHTDDTLPLYDADKALRMSAGKESLRDRALGYAVRFFFLEPQEVAPLLDPTSYRDNPQDLSDMAHAAAGNAATWCFPRLARVLRCMQEFLDQGDVASAQSYSQTLARVLEHTRDHLIERGLMEVGPVAAAEVNS